MAETAPEDGLGTPAPRIPLEVGRTGGRIRWSVKLAVAHGALALEEASTAAGSPAALNPQVTNKRRMG
jgi:hypothetical protein